jgi:hypothetical protein
VGDNPSFCHELLFVFYKAPSLTRAPESPTFSRPIDAEKSKSTSQPGKYCGLTEGDVDNCQTTRPITLAGFMRS